MAKRPVFTPILKGSIGVVRKEVSFDWHAGFAPTQKQKSVKSLHLSAASAGAFNLLEISTKSEVETGVRLSAFNLSVTRERREEKHNIPLESAFQGSKIFEHGGPYSELYYANARNAKTDPRLRSSGDLTGFNFFGKYFQPDPPTYFYDWLYIQGLLGAGELAKSLSGYGGFTDIEFNPKKSINCQAHSAALYVSCRAAGLTDTVLTSPDLFLESVYKTATDGSWRDAEQMSLL